MEKFVIQGNKPLSGEIEVRGAKNAAFPVLAATILTEKDCIIENLPRIEDVFRMIEILSSMGADIKWLNDRAVKVNTKNIDPLKINKESVLRFRGSVLFFGALLARFGKVSLPQPGGDIIGARSIDTHLDGFSQLGAECIPVKDGMEIRYSAKPKNQDVVLGEFSVTGTENLLLFTSLLPVKTTIKIADQDYQIQELATVLRKMGAGIVTKEPHSFTVSGKKKLKGFKHKLMYDPIEAGTFIVLAAATRGDITIKNVEVEYLDLFLKRMKEFGVKFSIINSKNGVKDIKMLPFNSLKIEKIQSMIYPGVSSDLQSVLGVLATQAKGSTLLHDPLYEGRLKYLEELNKMGAEIYIADPHRAIINGPKKLHGADLGTFDLRGGAAVIIAALVAKGESSINNIYQIDRGYEKIEERLAKLGADIKREHV